MAGPAHMSPLVHRPLGQRIPDRLHAVSCSLPTMRDVVGYEEKDPATLAHLSSGYPRFVVHPLLRRIADTLRRDDPSLAKRPIQLCAGPAAAAALQEHLRGQGEILSLTPAITALALPAAASDELQTQARRYLQHTGAFASSRAAEDWLVALGELPAVEPEDDFPGLGGADPGSDEADEEAAAHVRTRLSTWLAHGVGPGDIHLCASGMAATYAAFRAVTAVQAPRGRTRWIQLGWLYLDTIAILQKLTGRPTEDYLYHADVFDLEGLKQLLATHAGRVAGILAEVPTNPLIQTPPLAELAALCRQAGVALVVDPTIASPLNVNVLPDADLVVNSLTKYTAAEGDVILGAVIRNPFSPFASALAPALGRAAALAAVYPRDVARLAAQIDETPALLARINAATPRVAEFLLSHPRVARVHWSGEAWSRKNYESLARSPGSAASVLSFVLQPDLPLARFYDRVRIAKGPSFGLKTSLLCPFMYLAHYDLVTTKEGRALLERNGIAPELLRLSVGIEPVEEIIAALAEALD